MRERPWDRFVALSSILAGVLAFAALAAGGAAARWDFSFGPDYVALIAHDVDPTWFRRANLLDMLGYYLLLLPAVLWVSRRYQGEAGGFGELTRACGVLYVGIGGIGAAVLATAGTAALRSGDMKLARGIVEATYVGLWNTLEMIPAAVFFAGAARALRAQRGLAVLSLIASGAALLNLAGRVLELEVLWSPALSVYLGVSALWPLWFGLSLRKRVATGS